MSKQNYLSVKDQSNIFREPPSFSKNYNSMFEGANDGGGNIYS